MGKVILDGRQRGPYARAYGDDLDNHLFLEAGAQGRDLYAYAERWSVKHLSDGRVPRSVLRRSPWGAGTPQGNARLEAKLIACGLLLEDGDAVILAHFAARQDLRAEIEVRREKERSKKAKARSPSLQSNDSPGDTQRESRGDSRGIPIVTGTATAAVLSPERTGGENADSPPAPSPRPTRPTPIVALGTAACMEACEVFVEALDAAGWKRAPLRDRWEREVLCDAINTHLRADETVQGALSELRRAVTEWVDAYRERPTYAQGWGARKLGEWLAAGREQPPHRQQSGAPARRPNEHEGLDARERQEEQRERRTRAERRAKLPPLEDLDSPGEPMTPEERRQVDEYLASLTVLKDMDAGERAFGREMTAEELIAEREKQLRALRDNPDLNDALKSA